VLSSLEEFLHEMVRANIISRIHASPAADPRDRKELIEIALADNKAAREATAIEELDQYKPGDQLVFGLPGVIEVFNSFLVRKLVIGEKLRCAWWSNAFRLHRTQLISRLISLRWRGPGEVQHRYESGNLNAPSCN